MLYLLSYIPISTRVVNPRKYPHRPLDSFFSCGTIIAFTTILSKGKSLAGMAGLEPTLHESKSCVLPIRRHPNILNRVFRTSADFHALSLPFPSKLYEGTDPKHFCSKSVYLIPKNILGTLFYFVAPILEGISEYSFLWWST